MAVLERKQLVELWSDTKVAVGANWQGEIESGLASARLALILISPDFLASSYVWLQEIPRIVAHGEQGMEIVPLVVRPCAWRLEPAIEKLQARPSDGRALSGGSEHQIDLDLSNLTYELAGKLGMASLTLISQAIAPKESKTDSRLEMPPTRFSFEDNREYLLHWNGNYSPEIRMRLSFDALSNSQITGTIEYLGDDTVTRIEGEAREQPQMLGNDKLWPRTGDEILVALRFRETGYLKRGKRSVDFNGEYRAMISARALVAVWVSGSRIIREFALYP